MSISDILTYTKKGRDFAFHTAIVESPEKWSSNLCVSGQFKKLLVTFFFYKEGDLSVYHKISSWMATIKINYILDDWNLFIDSSKTSLKSCFAT